MAKTAYNRGMTLKQAAISLNILTEEEFDRIVDPNKMVHPDGEKPEIEK
jgi:fumarate hydratase class II